MQGLPSNLLLGAHLYGKEINDREGEANSEVLESHRPSLFQVWSSTRFYA